jgi:hypothetical protein
MISDENARATKVFFEVLYFQKQQKTEKITKICIISGFRCKENGNCSLLGCYAANSRNTLPTFRTTYRSHPQGSIFADETDSLSRNVGKEFTTIPCLISQKPADLLIKVLGYKTLNFNGKNKF